MVVSGLELHVTVSLEPCRDREGNQSDRYFVDVMLDDEVTHAEYDSQSMASGISSGSSGIARDYVMVSSSSSPGLRCF